MRPATGASGVRMSFVAHGLSGQLARMRIV